MGATYLLEIFLLTLCWLIYVVILAVHFNCKQKKGSIIIKPKLLNARKWPLWFEIVPISCLCLFCSHLFMTAGPSRLEFTLLSAELSFHARFVVWQSARIYYHP